MLRGLLPLAHKCCLLILLTGYWFFCACVCVFLYFFIVSSCCVLGRTSPEQPLTLASHICGQSFCTSSFFFPSCLVNSPSVKKLWSVPDIPSNLKSQHRVKRASVRQRKTLCTNIRPQHRRRDTVLKATICLTKKKKKGRTKQIKALISSKMSL